MDVMIDLETFGTSNNAVIVQIGAVIFDRKTGKIEQNTFFANVTADSCVKAGMEMDASTVEWWLKQSKEARESLFTEPRLDVVSVLTQFKAWLEKMFSLGEPAGSTLEKAWRNRIHLWSHATFDYNILQNAYLKAGVPAAFNFRGARDLRTLTDLGEVHYWTPEYEQAHGRVGVHHNALDDCIYQVGYTVEALNKVRNSLHPDTPIVY